MQNSVDLYTIKKTPGPLIRYAYAFIVIVMWVQYAINFVKVCFTGVILNEPEPASQKKNG